VNITIGIAEALPGGIYSHVSRYRHEVFVKKLGWSLKSFDGAELDQFDRPDTVYVVAQDAQGQVNGCARLLPTNQPYLLSEVFPQLMNGLEPPRSSCVWELSRFAAIDFNNQANSLGGQAISPIALELLREAITYVASRGGRRLISVSPVGVERLLCSAGICAQRVGPPVVVDGFPLIACWIEIESDFD